jgi:VanZ family protein
VASRQASILFLIVVLLAVIGLSLTPHPEEILGRVSLYDKAGHFAAYVVLAFFACRTLKRGGLVPVILVVAGCAALGGAIELIQPLVGRHRDIFDFLVDLAGAATGAAASSLVMGAGSCRRRRSA